uniref:CHD1 helical C-terminal domain containing 1 n=1 Tax=Pseudonaja textilis TaxID=8673 RepID=A0A670Z1X4_PSETE
MAGCLATKLFNGPSRINLKQCFSTLCKEYLRPFKKTLQRLNLPKDYPKERKLICTRKTLNILGDHINMFLLYNCKSWELKHWKKMLWRFVSLFSTLDEKQLYKLYRYSKTDQFTKFLVRIILLYFILLCFSYKYFLTASPPTIPPHFACFNIGLNFWGEGLNFISCL